MHDTRLHTEPEQMVFIRRPYFGYTTDQIVQLQKQTGKIFVRPSPEVFDKDHIHPIPFSDYELSEINRMSEPKQITEE